MAIAGLALVAFWSVPALRAQTDLDDLMRQVLARRDENWKKLQQYILDEREQVEVRGPSHERVWGERREYSWYIRDGYFVRSPLTFNGVKLSEPDRLQYEAEYLRRSREGEAPKPPTVESDRSGDHPAAGGVDGLLRQIREPEFVSSAYFLRFKFEQGRYAFVGREMLDGRETLRIEYFPTELYTEAQRRRLARSKDRNDPVDTEVHRMLNKVALVTLWVEPSARQILKYTFDNIDLDFLPGRWLIRLNSVQASMTMGQPFPDVWLPRDLEFLVEGEVASGRLDLRWTINYHDYRQPDVKSRIDVIAPR